MNSPLQQFIVDPIMPISVKGIDFTFTNVSFWMFFAVTCAVGFFMYCTSKRSLVPDLMQAFAENVYVMIAAMTTDIVGTDGKRYFPLILSIFMFVLLGNLLGMAPGGFSFTSQLAVTLFIAFSLFLGITLLGIIRHGFKFFSLFFPSGAPPWTAVVLVPIKCISYFFRPVSLGVRLFTNILVGHILLKVVASFIIVLGSFYILPGLFPFLGVVLFTALEIMIAVIQAYVFTVLTCVYLRDSLHLH